MSDNDPHTPARLNRNLSHPSQLCGRFQVPSQGGMSQPAAQHQVGEQPMWLLYLHGVVDPAAGAGPFYALVFDRLGQPGPADRAVVTIGPLIAGGTFHYSEPVTEWWDLPGDGGRGQLSTRQAMAGLPLDRGCVVVLSSTPIVVNGALGPFLSVFARGQR